uniref:Uncharacterized protein n=1 Tax=Marmota marmota marmota TaxID=9994 RepID=A0A8C6A5W2_MARMA
ALEGQGLAKFLTLSLNCDPPTSTSQVTRITGMHYHAQIITHSFTWVHYECMCSKGALICIVQETLHSVVKGHMCPMLVRLIFLFSQFFLRVSISCAISEH